MINRQQFFSFLQLAIGSRAEYGATLTDEQWNELYEVCKKQALLGVGFVSVQKLLTRQRPPQPLLLKWMGLADKIAKKNEVINSQCNQISKKLADDGFQSCILKGQGNALYYPEQLRTFRTPGDIDIWGWPTDNKPRKKTVIEYVLTHISPEARAKVENDMRLHHIDFPCFRNTPVELHFTPAVLNSPITNYRLQQFFSMHRTAMEVCADGYVVPKPAFNVIYQMVHIYKHLFTEGIGLRQLLDYYFLLVRFEHDCVSSDDFLSHKSEAMDLFKRLGMTRFVGAVMHVLQQVFEMPERYLLCQPHRGEGEFLLHEIMMAGNFGQQDTRYTSMKSASRLERFFMLTFRNWTFLLHYPSEVLWNPLRRAYIWLWRQCKLWRF